LLDLRLDEPYEVILVDDGSTDETARIAESFRPRVQVLRQSHHGAAAARNAGVRSAQGNVVLFTDADCEPVREWAAALVDAIKMGADGAKGIYRTRQRNPIARFVQAEYESKYRHMERRASIDFIDTYSAAYRRQVLVEAGGFKEELPVDEDQELSFRLAEAGKRLVFVPEAVVYHRHVSSPVDYVRRKFRIGYWKVFVGAMHPERMVSDSHTPQGMKVEMLLVGASLASLAAGPFSKAARRAGATFGLGFILATIPFASRLMFKEPAVAIIAPFMLLLRALGLGLGLLAGTFRLAFSRSHNASIELSEWHEQPAEGAGLAELAEEGRSWHNSPEPGRQLLRTGAFSSTIMAMRNPESENGPSPICSPSGLTEEAAADTAPGVTEDEPLLGAYESGSELSTPIFVEVITEEQVEYLAPERPVCTGDLIPESTPMRSSPPEARPLGAGVDTLPYPIISEEPPIDEDLVPDPIMEATEQPHSIPSSLLRPPFGTTAPLGPKPAQKGTDPDTGA
jgi:hypothetical protein